MSESDVTALLLNLASATRSQMSAQLNRYGLTWAKYEALKFLNRSGPSTSIELARALGRHRTTVGATVIKLERLRLVARTTTPMNTQRLIIDLTDSGARALAQADRTLATFRHSFNSLDVDDALRNALLSLHTRTQSGGS
ncbi:hypothetical protein E5720_17765 [Rhodococcus sp. PAMC28707]|uniref:MarR family winged helix-turn-helix transcriptional regulator n=1 Tax=unclassified Rhodococcus (in: high G+C Gram-positive bacteria) TaxID=192944 RepID=UPI00109DEBF6|nr:MULTISPECIES: MarR family transcriptional regulator [unclassified Rhodococcus (in: high G+C Gram-positive bacteria)]QCB51774.1 hypothetical protein E5769_17760 [Rhodococcus sp. PAMC28705]QCB60058.1 hypothetical protein E5720_17765 [Rhodococcus sp. PAMC28707]